MKLLELEMENFRQYMGKQKVEFASNDKNITIIFGENGKGKTGIFRALMFCLYGSTHIQQDNPSEPIHLVSMKLLDSSTRPVKASVRILFEHRGQQYEMTRSVRGVKRGYRIEERFDSVKLASFDEMGNYNPNLLDNELRVREKMNEILDEEIKDFFLFDAEKIDTLAKTDAQVKKEVKTAIFKLLQINNVEEAKALLDTLFNSEKAAAIRSAGNINIEAKQREIEAEKENIAGITELINQLEIDQKENNKLIDKYNLQLSQNEGIRIIQERIKMYQDQLTMKTNHLNDLKAQAVEVLKKDAAFLLFNSSFQNVKNYLSQLVSQQGSIVPADVLEQSLVNHVCACCNNDLSLHSENLEYVKALKENYTRSELTAMSSSIKNMIVDKENHYNETEQTIMSLLRKMNEIERERKEIIRDIDVQKKEIGSRAETELNLDKIKQALENETANLTRTRANIIAKKEALATAETKLVNLEKELKEMMRNNESLLFDSKVIERIDSLRQDIKDISNEFSTTMRHKLRDLTTDIFKKLIDRKDVNLISSININDKFELEIIGGEGIEITQDISQGQRQIVALSFITALAQVATGDNMTITFPLFMDSPFNRISGVNRDQLIMNIPNLTSQWVLLLTDTELTTSEERVFKEEGRLGKFYRINQIEPMNAKLEEVSLHEALTTRGM
ncbi:AAA family ATPase [Neobacillus sp. PS2-9]|uniref:AAA family ATPase n=1 Tax=Neobacillus sp. PS2-9 TaxID=3070676 RepID=UPI0027DFB747|nr:AAA family ATPase [Neobacillus sp. PS2-9]WML56026.1 AAA family ATPase [Neobacillus sp. PS2-9]